ncbi:DUF4326 domain-containing protein [Actinomyces procaprae]|uniref:DUF4326 domain-containing protein n=1 Tax=Actinomyces procaprae TaxID=2560010 RepID=UPI0010A28450
MSPRRIQRRRTAGWRMPDGAVYVGRPSRWGNPFRQWLEILASNASADQAVLGIPPGIPDAIHPCWLDTPRAAVEAYLAWLRGDLRAQLVPSPPSASEIRETLVGRDLACWCPLDEPCHADVLLAVAAGTSPRNIDLSRVTPAEAVAS